MYSFLLTYSCLYLIVYVCILICFFHIHFCSIHSLNCNFLISGLFLNLLILFIYQRPFIYLHISAIIYIVLLINLSTIPVHRLSWKKHKSDRHILSMAVWCKWDRRFDSDMRLYVVYVYCSYVLFVWGFMYEFISNMTKVGWFHIWIHVRHQKGRSWGGGGRTYIYIYIYNPWIPKAVIFSVFPVKTQDQCLVRIFN